MTTDRSDPTISLFTKTMMFVGYKNGRDTCHWAWPADTIKECVASLQHKYDIIIILEVDDYWAKFDQGVYETG